MAAPVLQFKRGLSANLPSLRAGEPGFSTDSYDFYVGLTSQSINNKFLTSSRFWTKETATTGSGVNLVEGTNNGSDFITLASPASVGAAVTYYFPPANGGASSVLTNNGSGVLSWASGSANPVFTGIATFSDTTESTSKDTGSAIFEGGLGIEKNVYIGGTLNVTGVSTFVGAATFSDTTESTSKDNGSAIFEGGLGIEKNVYIGGTLSVTGVSTFVGAATFSNTTESTSKDTGSIILEGGLGIEKNVYIGGTLNVTGVSTFVGAATFQGGTITLGDADSDNVVFVADVNSDIIPNTDNTFDLGNSARRWRNAILAGVGTFATGAVVDSIRIGITAASEIDTSSGDLTLDSASGQVIIDDNLSVSGISTFTGTIDSNGGLDVTGATILNTTLSVTGVSTFTGAIDANGGADISGGETVLSSATVSDLTAGRVVLAGTSGALEDSANLKYSGAGLIVGAGGANITGVSTFSTDLVVGGDVRINGNDIQASDGATNITLTSSTLTTFAGDIKVGGNDIQASDGNANITLTSNTLTAFVGDIKVGGNDIQASDGATNITLTSSTLTTFAGDIKVSGNDIQASDGTVAITLAGNDVTIADDLTVSGNLYVNGSTTQVNTTSLTVEDTLIELGFVNGVAPTSDLNKDLGLLLNYYSGSAKKAAVYWDDSVSRVVVANEVSESSSVLTASVYAAFEIGSLYVNDCAGATQVISCSGSERKLENITIDAGAF